MANEKKSAILGMPFGTACGKLRKKVLFSLLERHNENICFHCGGKIENSDHLSIEHKKSWQLNGKEFFWDLDNIAFSHLKCNSAASDKTWKVKGKYAHPSDSAYRNGCRCDECKNIQKQKMRRLRQK